MARPRTTDIERVCKVCNIIHDINEYRNSSNGETCWVCKKCNKIRRKEKYDKIKNDQEFKNKNRKRVAEYRKNRTPNQIRRSEELTKIRRASDKYKNMERNYYYKNKEKIDEYKKRYYRLSRENGTWRTSNPEGYMKKWRELNSERIKEYSFQYYLKNKDRIIERKKSSLTDRRDSVKAYNRRYRRENRSRCNALSAKRRAAKLQATPKWLTEEDIQQIKGFYDEAVRMSIETGIQYDVDHIHPLLGVDVCGLHVPWNLRVITHEENNSKNNKLLLDI